jgi:cytochrome c oxidase subunit 2
VLPGRYTTAWFAATRPGRYHLFCAEYCGAEHSRMGGWVTVMEPSEYERWLAGETQHGTLVATGEELFSQRACNSCHRPDTEVRGPWLGGLFGGQVRLAGGRTLIADETYIRESILNPRAKVVAGYQPIMPTFQGQLGEEELVQLLSYIKSLPAKSVPESKALPEPPDEPRSKPRGAKPERRRR